MNEPREFQLTMFFPNDEFSPNLDEADAWSVEDFDDDEEEDTWIIEDCDGDGEEAKSA